MCGIIGIFGENISKTRARQSLEKIVHRGTSTFEIRAFQNAIIGANRLPIVDRAHGKQPLSNEDETIFAVQNGEIFNYSKLQSELKEKGHKFRTESDTEVLAHLYEEYGSDMVKHLDSEMFAFVIYDVKNKTVFAARDPLGVKPLYYAHDTSGRLYFASELKQLVSFDDVEKVHTFPSGQYFHNGQFRKYIDFSVTNTIQSEEKAVKVLREQIVEAVRKRVQTDLPIGVLLSGGVDSSLIMEIATRFHPNITAIILGFPGSSDYEHAVQLCRERSYQYHVVSPQVDYEKELDTILYSLETYEPLIVRHAFANNLCARAAQQLGISIVLVGEGADELFAGYNEFASLPGHQINHGSKTLTTSLQFGHLIRVDRMSMRHTIEVRSPFLDTTLVKTALHLDGSLKIVRKNHQITTKFVFRKVAAEFLPDSIAWRYKVPFSNGAGMNVGSNYKVEDGDVAEIASKRTFSVSSELTKRYGLTTKESSYYFSKYQEFGFTKLVGSERHPIVKDSLNELYQNKKRRLVVAEFDRLGLYFPAYFAAEKGIFKLHDLDVDFVSTGGDDRTYASLVNNSAQIGLADPMFAMFENQEGVKGEIIGELVQRIPNVAVTINPNVHITDISDFTRYKVGTFQKFSTTHTMARYFLPKDTNIQPFDYKVLSQALADRRIDVAIVLPEQAIELESVGGRIVYNFQNITPQFLFSGFSIATTLEQKYRPAVKSFVAAMRESLRAIRHDPEDARRFFVRFFPEMRNAEKAFDHYLSLWSPKLTVSDQGYFAARKMWKSNYPELLQEYLPYFRTYSSADPVLTKINARSFRRELPFLEDRLQEQILSAFHQNNPLHLVGFWGAGGKTGIDEHDKRTITFLARYCEEIRKTLPGGVSVQFILADEHAKSNQYHPQQFRLYLRKVEKLLRAQGFQTVKLSDLWKKWKISQSLVTKALKAKKKKWWEDIPIAKELEEQAKKRFQGKDKLYGAQRYYVLRMLEKHHLERDFRHDVFFAYAPSRLQSILPTLPTLYLYTEKQGISDTPWFRSGYHSDEG